MGLTEDLAARFDVRLGTLENLLSVLEYNLLQRDEYRRIKLNHENLFHILLRDFVIEDHMVSRLVMGFGHCHDWVKRSTSY